MSVATKSRKPKKVAVKKAKAPKPPKAQKAGPRVSVDKVEWDHHKKCRTLAKAIDRDQAKYDELKKAAMEIKSSMSGNMVVLRRMLHNGPERLPLFDGPAPMPEQAAGDTKAAKDAGAK